MTRHHRKGRKRRRGRRYKTVVPPNEVVQWNPRSARARRFVERQLAKDAESETRRMDELRSRKMRAKMADLVLYLHQKSHDSKKNALRMTEANLWQTVQDRARLMTQKLLVIDENLSIYAENLDDLTGEFFEETF